jgi:hypothetical protein
MKYVTAALAGLLLLTEASCGSGTQAPPAPSPTPSGQTEAGLVPEDSKLLVVFANPVPGKDAEFSAWYDEHMRAFMKLPNFVRVQKFSMLSRKGKADPKFKYMFLFEFKGDQDESFARIQQNIKDGSLPMPDKAIVAEVDGSNYGPDGPAYLGPAAN